MPVNASIYNNVGAGVTPLEDPQNALLKALQVQQARLTGQQAQQGMEDDQALREATMASGGDQNKLMQLLYGRGQYKAAAGVQKSILDAQKAQADIGHVGAQAKNQNALADENSGKATDATLKRYRSYLDYIDTPEAAARWVQAQHQDPQIGGLVSKIMPLDQALQSIPQTPQEFAVWRSKQAQGIDSYTKSIAPKTEWKDNGQRLIPVETNSLAPGYQAPTAIQKQATPGEVMVDTRTREEKAKDRAQSDRHFSESQKTAGQAVTYQTDGAGNLVALPAKLAPGAAAEATPVTAGGKPLPPKISPLPEGAQKQLVGSRNLQDAIDGYQSVLSKWGNVKLLSPDAQAEMGNAYNNMMLQAKEAYNLGVLNGPDYDILQSVVKDPTKLGSVATSNKAMSGQAAKLKATAANIERTILESHGKAYTPRSGAPGNDLASAIDAEIARRAGGKK